MRTDIANIKKLFFIFAEKLLNYLIPVIYIACSESEKKAINNSGISCELLENCISDLSFNKILKGRRSGRKKISVITIGGVREQKGAVLFSEIARKYLLSDIDFNWIGDGDSSLKDILVDSGVRVLGWKDKSQISDYLSDASLYLSTSNWEGMPVSVIEAQVSGLPCLLKSCTGNVDLVNHGKNGFLFNDCSEAVRFIDDFLDNGWIGVTPPSIEEIVSRFSEENYGNNLAKIYFSI